MMRRLCILLLMLLAAAGCTRHKTIHSENDLPGARIGILTSSAHRAALEANFPGVTLRSFEDLPSMCLALRGRKIDALFCLGAGLDALLAGNISIQKIGGRRQGEHHRRRNGTAQRPQHQAHRDHDHPKNGQLIGQIHGFSPLSILL